MVQIEMYILPCSLSLSFSPLFSPLLPFLPFPLPSFPLAFLFSVSLLLCLSELPRSSCNLLKRANCCSDFPCITLPSPRSNATGGVCTRAKLGFDTLHTQEHCCSRGRQNLSLNWISKGEASSSSHPAFLAAEGWCKVLKMNSVTLLRTVSHRPKSSIGKDTFLMSGPYSRWGQCVRGERREHGELPEGAGQRSRCDQELGIGRRSQS